MTQQKAEAYQFVEGDSLNTLVEQRNPLPWYVARRHSDRSMYPIRDNTGHVVAYAYNPQVAALIVRRMGQGNST